MDIYKLDADVLDAYTIFLDKHTNDAISASEHGTGVYQHIEAVRGHHLGKKIKFTELSKELRHKLTEE